MLKCGIKMRMLISTDLVLLPIPKFMDVRNMSSD